jgi:hypothetical protein
VGAVAESGGPRYWPGFPAEAVGARVVVRRSLSGDGPPYDDVLGVLLASDGRSVLIRTRRGDESVNVDTVVAARLVGPSRGGRSPAAGPLTPGRDAGDEG